MKYHDHDGNLVDTEKMPEGYRPTGANYPPEGSVYSGGGSGAGDDAGCAPWWVAFFVLGLPAVKLAEAFSNFLGRDGEYTAELLAGWAGFGGAAIIATKLYRKYVDPEATGVKWTLTAIAVAGSLIYFANLTTPEKRQIKRAAIQREADLKAKQRLQALSVRPSSKMFGNQTVGNLCGAFSAFPVVCKEQTNGIMIASTEIAAVSIVDRPRSHCWI